MAFVNDVLLVNATLNALTSRIAVLDGNGVIVFVNEAWCRSARERGAADGEGCYLGANYLAVCRAASRQGDEWARLALAGLEGILKGQRDEFFFEYPCSTPDREAWFRMSATAADSGRAHIVVAHEEITASRASARAVLESERRLAAVLEALPVGVWILDADGRIVHGNAAGLRIWAGARYVGPAAFGEYKGWWLGTGEPIAAEEWAAARAIRRGETSLDEEIEIECFDGSRKIILNSAIPLHDDEGRITGAIIVNQDISARKHAELERERLLREQSLLRQEALAANHAKDEFIAILSHELRGPVQSTLGWAAMLRGAPDRDLTERAAAAIARSAQVQAQLLNDTLDASRIARGSLTMDERVVDLAALAGEMVDTMTPAAAEKRVTLEAESAGGRAEVRGDAVRLRQVLWNLLSNALKFTPAGGRIVVRTSAAAGSVELSVQDTGIGIPPDLMPHLFERFRQGSHPLVRAMPGLGLGLSIVKEIVTMHHGTIEAASAGEHGGATFTIRLPACR